MPQDFATEARLALLAFEATERSEEESWIRRLREYRRGEQPVYLTDRQEEYLGLKAKKANYPYAHNICQLVIDVLVERLHVTGFDDIGTDRNVAESDAPAEGQSETPAKQLSEYAAEWWDANRMDAEQSDLYEAAIGDGDGYIIVDWEAEKQYPRWTINLASDGARGVRVYNDPETNEPAFATKEWVIDDPLSPEINGLKRLNIYYPGRIEKYISKPMGPVMDRRVGRMVEMASWVQWYDMADASGAPVWPLPWTEDGTLTGVPMGLPVVPFANPHDSEINDVIPIQDMLNKADIDLAAAADNAGFRVYWVTGVDAQKDDKGNERAINVGPGRLLRFSNPAAAFGAIEPAILDPIINVGSYWIQAAAGVTRTPQHLFQPFGGTPPSGESLKEQEAGLVAKAERRQRVFGNAWEDVVYLSARLWNTYRPADQIPITRLQTTWKPAETRNALIETQVAAAKDALGVPREALWSELGYDQQTIEEFKQNARPQSVTGGILDALMRQAQEGAQTPNAAPQQPITQTGANGQQPVA